MQGNDNNMRPSRRGVTCRVSCQVVVPHLYVLGITAYLRKSQFTEFALTYFASENNLFCF